MVQEPCTESDYDKTVSLSVSKWWRLVSSSSSASTSNNVTVELHNRHPTPCGIVDGANDHDVVAPDAPWPDPPQLASVIGGPVVQFVNLKKGIHGAPDLMSEQGDGGGDGIVRARLVADLDLALEFPVPGPGDTEIRRRLFTELRGVTRIAEAVALTGSGRLERDAESPIGALEKNGHLQLRLDLLSSVDGGGMLRRRPHRLRDHRAPGRDAAVKQPTTCWAGMLGRDVGRDGVEEEEMALPTLVGQGGVWGNGGALQKIEKVLFGCTAPEGLGYVPVNEKCLNAIHRLLSKCLRGDWGKNVGRATLAWLYGPSSSCEGSACVCNITDSRS